MATNNKIQTIGNSMVITKKHLDEMIESKRKQYVVLEKKQIRLKEDDEETYVEPSSNNIGSLTTDIASAKTKNPSSDTFLVNTSSYNNNGANTKPVTLDINADSPSNATRQIQQTMTSGPLKSMSQSGKLNARVHLSNEGVKRMTKKELREFLKK